VCHRTPHRLPAPVGILLAAGVGSRFDPTGTQNKLLAPLPHGVYRGEPVAFAAAARLREVLPRVIAVVRPRSKTLCAHLERAGCEIVVCEDAVRGMGASLAAAAGALQATATTGGETRTGCVVALADMPWLQPVTIASVAAAIDNPTAIAAPSFHGKRGHPVGFGAGHLAALAALDGDEGARRLLASHEIKLINTDDAGAVRDVDTPEDLQ
jgi:molybdenum cofactor cytidylyltransferase